MHIFQPADGPDAALPVAARVPADQRHVRMPRGQFRDVERRGLAGIIPVHLHPGVLENDRLQLGRAPDDRVEFLRGTALRDPQFHADHRAVRDTAFEFGERGIHVLRIQRHEAKRLPRMLRDRAHHLVVLPAELRGLRILRPLHAHINAQAPDAHARRDFNEPPDAFLRKIARHTGKMAMEIPYFHVRVPVRRGSGEGDASMYGALSFRSAANKGEMRAQERHAENCHDRRAQRKSCETAAGSSPNASGVTRSAFTWITRSACCTVPSMARKDSSPMTSRHCS